MCGGYPANSNMTSEALRRTRVGTVEVQLFKAYREGNKANLQVFKRPVSN
jgi:hypothetical protein